MGGPVRVATIPDDHPYLDAVLPPDVVRVRFAEPDSGWAPSPLLTPGVARQALSDLDLVHVHFGYESLTKPDLRRWLTLVRDADVALVVTVHDLRNPHLRDPAPHLAHLDALLEAADEVITLTPGAAAEIWRLWQREATVLAHPSLLQDQTLPMSSSDSASVVGIHLKSLRANVAEPGRLIAAAAEGAHRAGAVLRVDLHPDQHDPDGTIEQACARSGVELRVHDRFTDEELLAYLAGLSVSVLPYRFGTHSGWLELCRDLGTAVVVPDCGYYAEQWPEMWEFVHNEDVGLDADSLSAAVEAAVRAPRPAPADRRVRAAEVAHNRRAHETIYRRAVAAMR